MALKNVKPIQVLIENLKVVEFFDAKFVGLIEKNFEDYTFLNFSMYKFDKEKNKMIERIAIFHRSADSKDIKMLTVDTDNPKSLEKMLKIIEEYVKDK